MPEENIRTYTFNVPGFIPGVPGNWPAGSWATINEDTKEVLDFGPKPVEPEPIEPETPPALPVQSENTAPVQQAG